MTFQFKVHPTASGVASRVAYYLPEVPPGISYHLSEAIKAYTQAVQTGSDGEDDTAFEAIKAFKAKALPEVIAKVVYQIHSDRRGMSEDGDLIILEHTDADTAAIELAQTVLGELYAQIPDYWEAARRALHAAILVEDDFDRRVYNPAMEANGGHLTDPCAIVSEQERLLDARCDAETVLLNIPAPSLADWALKFLICFDCDRDMNGHTEALCTEARALLGVTAKSGDDHGDDLLVMAAAVAARDPASPLNIQKDA